jgi:hypothetical protein
VRGRCERGQGRGGIVLGKRDAWASSARMLGDGA